MKKKGFTLIELLAVIIILAIIALIATPIIMRVIERSKKEAAERGAENYVRAVETELMALRVNGEPILDEYQIKENGNICKNGSTSCSGNDEIVIEMTGTKPRSGSIAISNGKVQSTGTSIVIGDYTTTIAANGSATATKTESESSSESSASTPRYYSWASSGNISTGLPSDADTDLSNITIPHNYPIYLAFDSSDGETIDAAYACITKGEPAVEYCIQGGDSGAAFTSNQGILDTALPNSCFLYDDTYLCSNDFLANVDPYGTVGMLYENTHCAVEGNGNFSCAEH